MHSQWKSYLTLWTVVFSWATLFQDAEQQQVEETPRQPCNQRGQEVELNCIYMSDFWYFHFQQNYHYETLSEVLQDQYWYLDPFTKVSLVHVQISSFFTRNSNFSVLFHNLKCTLLWNFTSAIVCSLKASFKYQLLTKNKQKPN